MNSELTLLIIYPIAKFVCYTLWCACGIKWLTTQKIEFGSVLKLGIFRWVLGLGFGFLVFLTVHLHHSDQDNIPMLVVLIYTPIRVIEWGIILHQIYALQNPAPHPLTKGNWMPPWQAILWILIGIMISFATDSLLPKDGLFGTVKPFGRMC